MILVDLELILGASSDQPNIRLLSMPTPTVMIIVGLLLLATDTCHLLGYHMPVRISSLAPGALARPGVYTTIEDVVAVDGGAGRPYREALNARYQASPTFRRTLLHLSLFWSLGAIIMGGICTAVIFTVPVEIAFGIGWGAPWVWAGLWTVYTVRYLQSKLALERLEWAPPPSTVDEKTLGIFACV